MERKIVMYNGVSFKNFPVTIEDGEEMYPLDAGIVARSVSEEIPEILRPAVSIDYEKIHPSFFEKENEDSPKMNAEELQNAEEKLIKVFFGEEAK